MTDKHFFIEQLKQNGEWKIIFSFHGYQAAEHFYFRCVNNNPNGCYKLKSHNRIIFSNQSQNCNE